MNLLKNGLICTVESGGMYNNFARAKPKQLQNIKRAWRKTTPHLFWSTLLDCERYFSAIRSSMDEQHPSKTCSTSWLAEMWWISDSFSKICEIFEDEKTLPKWWLPVLCPYLDSPRNACWILTKRFLFV